MILENSKVEIHKNLIRQIGSVWGEGLKIGKYSAEDLANRFGTPLYAFNAEAARENLARVSRSFGERVGILYALKANPNVSIGRIFRSLNVGVEVASAGEILIALKAGFSRPSIRFSGPGKRNEDLIFALENRIGAINIESEREYEKICELARFSDYKPVLTLRVNPKGGASGSRMSMAGKSKKFGIDQDRILDLARRISTENACELEGLHIYAGTQCFDHFAWLENAKDLLNLADELEKFVPIRTLNFGGGFGVALFDGDPEFDLDSAGKGLRAMISKDGRPERKYFIELGRYLVANSGVYLSRILYKKKSFDRNHLILDGGMHHHSAAAGIGAILRRPFPIVSAKACNSLVSEEVTLGGVLCTPADEFASGLSLPECEEGDVIGILGSGAYGLTFSNILFLSHPSPAEVLVDGEDLRLIRERGKIEDALRGQVFSVLGQEGIS
ncbi:diaminopimelate decarboxylase [Leptospira fletcheri]|uniref:Diaminopimelate decarboxylase n=1 Tax=Leptospira fletcheri TaxID=2484981 RepID=A0A4R9G4G8_9LEPT|nr:diaminopimelate decarboxylase [Leptospira fletcheri]TGK06412.1 diaminopimelate decarboxylase [Leptospira fletcheri]